MRRSRTFSVGLLAAGLWLAGRAAPAQQIPVGLGGVPTSFVGVPFDVPVTVDLSGRTDLLGSFALTIRWNPLILAFLSGKDGNFGALTTNVDSAAGIIQLTGANPAGVGGHVVVGVGRFVPLQSVGDTFKIGVSELYAARTFADLLPSAVWGNKPFCPAVGRYGDIDGNAAVNSADALAALTYAVGKAITGNPAVGDVDGDGITGARDALVILAYAVGLDVSEFRIQAPAAGGCGAAPGRLPLQLIPGNVTLDLAQQAHYVAVATDSTGAGVAVTDLTWSSTDPTVARVDSTGIVSGLAPGAATIRVIRLSGDTASATVTVLQRHTHWVDAFASPDEDNQLGAPELPFKSIQQGLDYARAGDTIRVRVGRYEEVLQVTQPVTIWGDTTLDGKRPRLAPPQYGYTGITVTTAGTVTIGNLAMDGFDTGVRGWGRLDTLRLDGVRVSLPRDVCGSGGVQVDTAAALLVSRSILVGEGQLYGCGSGVSAGAVQTLALDRDQILEFGYYAVYVTLADSVAVTRSALNDSYYALYVSGGLPGALALVVDQSRFERNYYSGIYAEGLRSGLITRSVIDDPNYYDDGITAYGDSAGHGYLRVVGDSIRTVYQNWISAQGLDSVLVDSLRVWGNSGGGNFYNVRSVRVTHAAFEDQYPYSAAIQVTSGSGGGQVVVDSVSVSGSATCTRCADGVSTSGAVVSVNRFAGRNLDYGLYLGDSSATVTNSMFSDVYAATYAYSGASPAPRFVARKVAVTDATYGIQTQNFVTVVDSVNVTGSGGYEGIYTLNGGADTVRASTVSGFDYGIDLEDSLAYIAGNLVQNPLTGGIYHSRADSVPGDTSLVLNNTVVCNNAGAQSADGIYVYLASHRVAGNTVNGCSSGLYLDGPALTLVSIARGNTVALPSLGNSSGILSYDYGRAEIVGNTVTGGGSSTGGAIWVEGLSAGRIPAARVDSNVVQNPQGFGIRGQYVDSLQVRGNLVQDVTVPCCYSNGGGIAVENLRYAVHVVGNTLRRVHGAGVSISQADTATVAVDSNAVSGADTAAVRLLSGAALVMQGNNIRNNARDGLSILTSFGYYQAHGNAFQGNGRYALYSTADATVNATQNWWGVDDSLPGTPGADSVWGVVDASSPLSAEPAGLPALAPPVLVASAPVATAVQTASAGVMSQRGPRVPRSPMTRAAMPAPHLPTGGVMAERLSRTMQVMTERRAGRDARLAAWRSALEARAASAAAARGARDARKTQHQTARPGAPRQ